MNQIRIRWIAGALCFILMLGVLAGCGATTKKASEPGKSDKPFAGKKLTVFLLTHPWGESIKSFLPEFESATGIKVEFQGFSEAQLSQKLTVQFTSQSDSPDIYMYRPYQEKILYDKNGWTEPLDAYVKKDASYEFEDFTKASVTANSIDNKLTSVPLFTDQEILYYRKDLLEKAGLAVPKTLDELQAAAKKLNDPNAGIYGFVARGQSNALVTASSSFLFSEGGDFTKGDKATVNSPEVISGFTIYGNLLKNYGPPGVLNMSWQQAMGIFAQGKAAFYTDASSIYKNAIDPDKSLVKDKVGYALFPAGKAGSKPFNVTSWALAMNSKSTQKDAAWEFMKWATSKDIVLKTQRAGTPGPRNSAWEKAEGTELFPAELVSVIKESGKVGVGHNVPEVISVGEARDVVGNIGVKAILGENVKEAAEKANLELQAIMEKDKKK